MNAHEAECPICLDAISKYSYVVTKCCNQKIDIGCFFKWVYMKENCPICRTVENTPLILDVQENNNDNAVEEEDDATTNRTTMKNNITNWCTISILSLFFYYVFSKTILE